ncbi:zinc-dependent metalloprotease [Actinotalea sp. BY-33]|uniref:Zinc-dependent metalloprotease n=1 Tax=Actinotalea soli TaxID=2819234 RepID=A0A939LVN7_9CELL|nr:zinc-dependent metalloprotease [Actinotalea soli]MBO1752989.1 zinc-dependent metalloprotease [Actinotalea soli]
MTSASGSASAGRGDADPAAPPRLELDWEVAGRWGGRLASPGPTPSRGELEALVADLHASAGLARPLALQASRLGTALERVGATESRARVLVVDRAGWSRAAAQSFAGLTAPSQGHPGTGTDATDPADGLPVPDQPGASRGLGRAIAGARAVPVTAQAAGLLGLLAGRVLGQFDPFAPAAGPAGRLLLVAPNVLRTERALAADRADFRLWVCVHEQTHALQFAAAPWLVDHLRREIAALAEEVAGSSAGQDLAMAVARGLRALRTGAEDPEDWSMLDLVLDEAQRDRVAQVTAVMSLLEGHADVTMDAVGRRWIPTVRRLRARMEARRRTATGVDRWLRRLVGMDAKLAQYRRGAAFVRGVRRAAGRDALDAAWAGPEGLPTAREVVDPSAWVRRVHG